MSTDTETDETLTNPDLPVIDQQVVSTGAAADSSETDERLQKLPRILRYAMLVDDTAKNIEEKLVAEIDQLCPDLPLNAAWAAILEAEKDFAPTVDVTSTGLALADELDRLAVVRDNTNLRSLSDCVRMLVLPAPIGPQHLEPHRRVAKSLLNAFQKTVTLHDVDDELCAELEKFTYGWAALPACRQLVSRHFGAAANAAFVGKAMAEYRIASAKEIFRRQAKEREEKQKAEAAANKTTDTGTADPASAESIPEHHLVVARLSDEQMKNTKLKDILGPLKNVINRPLPLVLAPPLHQVREQLLFEFPYAVDAIDFALADLVGRATVKLRPLLLVGDPGGGKSRFTRRLGEVLGLSVWREDASRADGAVFGGTDRRWYSAEPCHPFLAIGQGTIANPLVLIDELEKAGTRSDYGRLWDCLLGFLEPETSARYPDPALQVTLDLSEVSYVATANSIDPLPSPIRDRFRVVTFPKPKAADLDALLPAVIADLARERSLDSRWMTPLDGVEHAAIAHNWRGGSVRRLRRIVETVLRERDLRAVRN